MDWGPGYREQQPPAGLLPSVACLWARVVGPGAGAVAAVLPDACVHPICEQGRGLFVPGPDPGAPAADRATAAAELGYADQPHLTRECVRLAGVTPAALVAARRPPGRAGHASR